LPLYSLIDTPDTPLIRHYFIITPFSLDIFIDARFQLNITLMLIRLSRDDAAFRYFALAYA
jgi:hypothetical protein